MLTIDELVMMARRIPVITEPDPLLWIRLLGHCSVFPSLAEFKIALNDVAQMEENPTVIFSTTGDNGSMMLPRVEVMYSPTADPEFGGTLCRQFGRICSQVPVVKQSEVPQRIEAMVRATNPDLVVAVFIDGLSFFDVDHLPGVMPCFVDGHTMTRNGMLRLRGLPPLSERLFGLGYRRRHGFSYWDRHNDLGNELFSGFVPRQVTVVRSFKEAVDAIGSLESKEKTYVQMIRVGLDGIAHSSLDKPLLKETTKAIQEDVSALLSIVRSKGSRFLLVVCADHGILWDESLLQTRTLGGPPSCPSRYYLSVDKIPRDVDEYGCYLHDEGVFALSDSYFRRALTLREWGCHGGLSARESFVPFLAMSS